MKSVGSARAMRAQRMYEDHATKYLPESARTPWFGLSPSDRGHWMKAATNEAQRHAQRRRP